MQSIHLQGIGQHIAKPACEVQVGDTLVWNYGHTSEVVAVEAVGKASVRISERCSDGKVYVRTRRASTMTAYVAKKEAPAPKAPPAPAPAPAQPAVDVVALRADVARLERDLAGAQAKSTRAMEARMSRPAGTSRARATTLNANWARAAEHRDRVAAALDVARERLRMAEQ